jgi:hypothetical protein
MSPVTALLESLHSSMIDELTERHPEPKPGLGMPVRQPRFASPHPDLGSALACEVALAQAQAVVILAFAPAALKALRTDTRAFWDSLLKRAGTEFMRRGIRPRLGKIVEIDCKAGLPAGMLAPQRLIWIPFSLGSAVCFLGIGA